MSAQPVETMVDDEPTVVCASSADPPASGVHPSAPPEEKRDTLYDPRCAPPVPWRRRALDLVFALLAFLGRPFQRIRERLDPPPLASFLPPPPLHRKGEIPPEQIGEILIHNVFRLSPAYLDAAGEVLHVARLVQGLPERDRRVVFVHFAITRLASTTREPVPIAWVRARLHDVHRTELNRALEQLEAKKAIELHRLETDDERAVRMGISDPIRGNLTHIELRSPL